jgi:putative ABC transport system substrate-binding protein
MRRREFVKLLGGAITAWPRVALAQSNQMRRVGVLMGYPETDAEAQAYFAAFRDSLRRLGWIDGRNIRIDTRWATPGDASSMHRFAKELVALQPDLILSNTTPTTAALLQQTRGVPIVFAMIADPVGTGFVASFAHPGGNATGFVVTEGTLGGKWVELLREIAPKVVRMAMLFNPATAAYAQFWLKPFKAAAASYSVEAIDAPVHDTSELETVIAARAREPNTGLVVMPDSFTDAHRVEITSLASRYPIPAIYAYRFFTALGGLISYGIDLTDNFRLSATYVDRILKGEKPADLPVQAPTKYVLTINLKTARALGLDVPLHLQQLADEVIE